MVNQGEFSDNWKFVRRFFVYDTISGIDQSNGYQNMSVPTVVRWANSIKFKITLDPSFPERIFNPYIEISYKERQTNMIHKDTKTSVSFIMDYY